MAYTYHWRTKPGVQLTDDDVAAGIEFLLSFANTRRNILDTVFGEQFISVVCKEEWGQAEPVMFGRCPHHFGPVCRAARGNFIDRRGRIRHGTCETTGEDKAHFLVRWILTRLNREALADKLDIWGDDGPVT